jgi:hypothetical protein
MTTMPVSARRRAFAGATLLTVFWLAFATGAAAQVACPPAAERASRALVAEFTGSFDRGTPVYRLPSMSVTVGRTVAAADARGQKRDPRAQGAKARSPS